MREPIEPKGGSVPVSTDPERAREIGRRIAQARQEAGGMTQRELGELIGVTDRSVIAYEKGEVIPFRFLRKIEEATGVSAAWILHGENAPMDGHGDMAGLKAQIAEMGKELRALRREIASLRKALNGSAPS